MMTHRYMVVVGLLVLVLVLRLVLDAGEMITVWGLTMFDRDAKVGNQSSAEVTITVQGPSTIDGDVAVGNHSSAKVTEILRVPSTIDSDVAVGNHSSAEPEASNPFAYDRGHWESSTRTVVMMGPYKTASTSIQNFLFKVLGATVSIQQEIIHEKPATAKTNWIFPVGARMEVPLRPKLCRGTKSHACIGFLVTCLRPQLCVDKFFLQGIAAIDAKKWENAKKYYRSIIQRPWKKGKNIIIATEVLAGLMGYTIGTCLKDVSSDRGEETYVAPCSNPTIDRLLDLLSWNVGNFTIPFPNNTVRVTPLQLEDIEVYLNYRLPRMSHVASIWREKSAQWPAEATSFREFMVGEGSNYIVFDSLGMAFQLVRRGMKTTIVDMKGVYEHEASLTKQGSGNGRSKVLGGLIGIVGCDILKMGRETDFCDDQSRLHLPVDMIDGKLKEKANARSDLKTRNLTESQMNRMERRMKEYDCGVWQHLRKYQEQGLFRILYPSRDLFNNCKPGMNNRNVSLSETMLAVGRIASENIQ